MDAITPRPGQPAPASPEHDHATGAALDHLGQRTARARGRGTRKVERAFSRWSRAGDRLLDRRERAERARERDHGERESLARVPERERHRGLSNLACALVLVFLWLVNFPIAVQTFQVFDLSLLFTIQLALAADAVFLLVGHLAGVTLRRAHDSTDPGLLGNEAALGWALLGLGVTGAVGGGWVRLAYLQETGDAGIGLSGVAFTTIITVATFLVAVLTAWRHHNPAVGRVERASRRRWLAERRLARARGVVRRRQRQAMHRVTRRRTLAQRVVGRADRIVRHGRANAARAATTITVEEPEWLGHERALARNPQAGGFVQPPSLHPDLMALPSPPPHSEGDAMSEPPAA
jgi:hypothetical protein